MRRVLVTGGTGFLGRHLVARLQPDVEVRILARSDGATHRGSILDRARLAEAMRDCDGVFHLAGRVDWSRHALPALRALHVEGTAAVIETAAQLGVQRVVYASTSGTIAVGRDPLHLATEEDPAPTQQVANWPYYATKLEAEQVALERAEALGVACVCVNPSLLLGPGDVRRSSTGDVVDLLEGRVPAIPSGGLSFVDVRDVAEVMVTAWTRGTPGERYLLGAANWSLDRFFEEIARIGGVRKPRLRAPDRLTRLLAGATAPLFERVGRSAPLKPVVIEMSQAFWYLDASKAVSALDFSPRDPLETLRDTIADIRGF